ncbi:DUF1572 domain-containing protein [Aquimarina sp. W85]|uniref:DUF1572 domain-containing protein n=1 Tax=Aquimarina rhodophyticola TaxID=3342246 RepID=UPI00366A9112
MKLSKYLANRLTEVLTEGTWVSGTNFKSQIIALDWHLAKQQVADLNTIADITYHVHYYIAGVLQVLQGGPLEIRDAFSFDAPPITSAHDWDTLVLQFCKDSDTFINEVRSMTDTQLHSDFIDKKYGNYHRNIDVLIEHTYYHLGQVVLVKKLVQRKAL